MSCRRFFFLDQGLGFGTWVSLCYVIRDISNWRRINIMIVRGARYPFFFFFWSCFGPLRLQRVVARLWNVLVLVTS